MRKKVTAVISFLILIIIMIVIIACFKTESIVKDESKIQIVATLFPQYDFAKQIVGDKANVKLLLNSGVEAHNYEPTAKDMITITNISDVFLYTGTDLEPWTESIVQTLEENNSKIVDVSENIELIKVEEFEEKFINKEIVNDNNEIHNNDNEIEINNKSNNNSNFTENHNHEHEHEHIYDEHIWLNPLNAIKMIDNILNAICQIDPENSEYYKSNAENYKNEIVLLNEEIQEIVDNAERKEIAVGGEFAYAYMVNQYDIKFVSVYNNCGEGEDPSIAKVKSVIDYINKYNMPAVFYEELSEGTVAKMIAEETEAETLVLYSIHNGDSQKDSYVSLMKKNIENLRKGIK